MRTMANEFNIAPGAVFDVTWRPSRDEAREFRGTYRGMSVIGTETALVFDVDGTIRYLPAAAVACMDQVEAAPDDRESRKADDGSVFYG